MSNRYIHFTEEQKEQARQTDLVSLLRSQGEMLKRSGSEWEWKDGSQKVTVRGNLWFHQYEQVGGDAIDFVRRFMGKDYPQAVEYLLGECGGTLITSPPIQKEPPKPFELPPRNDNMRRVYAYLINRRGIDRDVVYAFANRGMIYESADYHNAVFVGYDQDGIPRHAHKRGTGSRSTFKGNVEGGLPEYSFHWTGQAEPAPNPRIDFSSKNLRNSPHPSQSGSLYLFEAPIDMLSFISLHSKGWRKHSYAACCGVSDRVLWQMLKDNPQINSVYLCLDHDEAGQKANKRISDALFVKGVTHEILIPNRKDWNEDRLAAGGNDPHYCADFFIPKEVKVEGEEKSCQALQL